MNIQNRYEKEFFKFLKCLKDSNCLDSVIVIGSWAEYLYDKTGVLKDFEPAIQTIDVDFLIPNINKPRDKANLISTAKEAGFIYYEDSITATSRFIGEDNFEIEFLVNQVGDGSKKLPRTTIGVNAQQLTHLGLLKKYLLKVEVSGFNLFVPEPEAYVLHKMIINERRGIKAGKDRQKIEYLYPFLEESRLREESLVALFFLFKKEENVMSNCQLGNPNNSISREINIRELVYHLYIIDWYNMHLSANRISKEYIEYYTSDVHEDMSFSDWIEENGFGGELYVCYNEFLEYEYRDKEYICTLLNNVELEKLYLADVETLE